MPPAITGTLRLVLRKDPAIGQWLVYNDPDRGPKWSQNDPTIVSNLLVQVGNGFLAGLNGQIQSARSSAFDQIEKSLADHGLFKRVDADTNVIISQNHGIAYYTQPADLRGGTYGDAEKYCGGVTAAGYHWRLPSLEELRILVGTDTKIIDVPDGRLWRSITQANPGQAIFLVANTFIINNGPELTLDMINPADLNQYEWGQILQNNKDSTTFTYGAVVDVRNARNFPVTGGGGLVRVMCVATQIPPTTVPTNMAATSSLGEIDFGKWASVVRAATRPSDLFDSVCFKANGDIENVAKLARYLNWPAIPAKVFGVWQPTLGGNQLTIVADRPQNGKQAICQLHYVSSIEPDFVQNVVKSLRLKRVDPSTYSQPHSPPGVIVLSSTGKDDAAFEVAVGDWTTAGSRTAMAYTLGSK